MAQVVLHLLCECLPALQAQSPEFKSQSHKKKKKKERKKGDVEVEAFGSLSIFVYFCSVRD
jgi:hypothetical protein